MSSRGGTAQAQRSAPALADHYFDVDELSLPQLLVIALDSARQVGFDGHAANTSWDHYFKDDEIFFMADILATRVPAVTARFEQALTDGANAGADARALPALMLRQWTGQLGRWSGALTHHGGVAGADLGAMLAGLLRQLERELQTLGGPDGAPQRAVALGANDTGDAPSRVQGRQLRAAFHQVMKAVEMAQRAAEARLPQALRSGGHDPGIGMLVAFGQLYLRAQEKLNRFTARHRDFYYEHVLRVRPRGPQRDATFLVFESASPGIAIPVASGTRFLAPYQRSAPDLEFVTEHSMVVTDAKVVALHTVFFERNRLSFPESKLYERVEQRERRYPTACRLHDIALPRTVPGPGTGTGANPAASRKEGECEAAPLFGAPRSATMAPPGKVARIGFALASNVLLMRHGERKVDVALHLGSAGAGRAARLWQRMELLLDECTQAMEKATPEQGAHAQGGQAFTPDLLYRVLNRMFTISVSGSAGWIEIAEYSASFTGGEGSTDTLNLTFRLGADAAAVVPYTPELHGEQYPGNCPMVRFELNALAYVYPYGLLRALPLVRSDIVVAVRGHRALELQNQIGLLSAASPFQPFGPLPAVGSYLIVGSAETACKNLTSFDLVLEWGGLPRAARGLGAYYEGYTAHGTTPFRDVRANLSVLSDGAWVPFKEPDRQLVTLFGAAATEAGEAVAVARHVRFDRILPQGRCIGRIDDAAPFIYSPGARGGFFKLTLAGPEFMFGHRDYPFVLADSLSHNGQPRNRTRLHELPAAPYTPLLDALWLNYRATASIVAAPSATGDAFLRLSPLGWDAARGTGHGRDLLLPRFDDAGNLYIGLSASDLREPLTLFFHLREDALPMVELAERELRWAYLADNAWHALKPHAVRADTTHAFLRAGIVTLTLPPDIGCDSTDMPPGLYWLRVSCDTDLERFCSLYSISTHAAQVFRDLDAVAAPHAPAAIPAGTITRPRQIIPGLGRVTQVTASYGGRVAENGQDMRRRTAERLHHKGQAITPDDYERLILQQFPQIDRVKCFANLSVARKPKGDCCPGHVLIVGLPAFASNGHLSEFPRLNGYLIGQVRRFVEAHMSPSVILEVVNPVYQHIQVRCTVVLRAGSDPGWYVNLLDELISDFISPWSRIGNTSHFGWVIRRHEVESLILAQDGVVAVSGFSMLSVSGRDLDLFSLKDTAAPGVEGEPVIEPTYPWSIAVPIKRHHITIKHAGAATPAAPTGIGQMEIGSTFIIGARRDEK